MLVPSLLFGTPKSVRRDWMKAARAALKKGGWDVALEGVDMVDFYATDGDIFLIGANMYYGHFDGLQLFEVRRAIWEVTLPKDELSSNEARTAWYCCQRDFVFESMTLPWFCLSMLGEHPLLPIQESADEERVVACRVGMGLLAYWDDFCRLAPRLAPRRSWLIWAMQLRGFADRCGITDDDREALRQLENLDDVRQAFTKIVTSQ